MKTGLTKNYGKYDVSITYHALQRMVERRIYQEGIVRTILSVVHTITAKNKKMILIFTEKDFSLIVKKEGNAIIVITAIRGQYESNGQELYIAV